MLSSRVLRRLLRLLLNGVFRAWCSRANRSRQRERLSVRSGLRVASRAGRYGAGAGGCRSGRGWRKAGDPNVRMLAPFLTADSDRRARRKSCPPGGSSLPKGAFIDCTLETAIDSTLPGMTTCITATDTFGDGRQGRATGARHETGRRDARTGAAGSARVFVAVEQARTPTGVVVPLDSPGTDELGRSGLPGEVNRHFWQRFGAAMLISLVDGAVQAAAQSSSRSAAAPLSTTHGARTS